MSYPVGFAMIAIGLVLVACGMRAVFAQDDTTVWAVAQGMTDDGGTHSHSTSMAAETDPCLPIPEGAFRLGKKTVMICDGDNCRHPTSWESERGYYFLDGTQ